MRYPTGHTHIYAILAHPVAHVRAAEFFNPKIEAARRDAFLLPFHILPDDLEVTVQHLLNIQNLRGFVVTIPHKPVMARMCTELGPGGRLTGTVNTVRIEENGRMVGDMFDGLGLVDGAKANNMDPHGLSVLLVGCGGAGRAIAFALADAGVTKLVLTNRSIAKAEELAAEIKRHHPSLEVNAGAADGRGFDLVIQATSLGLHATDPMPIDPATLKPGSAFIDIIAARDTEIMQAAKEQGCRVIGGRPMVDYQIKAQLDFLDAPFLD